MDAYLTTPDDNPSGDGIPDTCDRCTDATPDVRYRPDWDARLCDACADYEPPTPTDDGADASYAPALIDAGRGHLVKR